MKPPANEPRAEAEFLVPEGSRIRLDVFLAHQRPDLSRRKMRAILATGRVRINGRPARKGQAVCGNDLVHVDRLVWDTSHRLARQAELPVRVLYEDPDVVAIYKPSGMPSVALRLADRDTLANFLIARYPETGQMRASILEAGVVHRLDTGTSGVMLVARTEYALSELRRQFQRHTIEKQYIALVKGHVTTPGCIRTPIAHVPRRRHRMCTCPDPARARALRARLAITHYRPLAGDASASLVEIAIPTGVRHQIRVHLASVGHPVLGEPIYDTRGTQPGNAPRLMLHASHLSFRHPVNGKDMVVATRIPADFQPVLRQLPEHRDADSREDGTNS